MASLEIRIIIEHLLVEGYNAADIKSRLEKLYPDLSPCQNTLYYWIRQIKMGRVDLHDEVRLGPEITVRTPEMVKKVREIVMGDRRLKLHEISDLVYASTSTIQKILRHDLNMRKVSARWVPKLLTPAQMQFRVDCARSFLERCGDDRDRNRRRDNGPLLRSSVQKGIDGMAKSR